MHSRGTSPDLTPQPLSAAIKMFAYFLAAPFFLVAVLAAFTCVLLDFAWFRTHALLEGHPQPKGLWEF